jgi:hypothetical protein
MRNVESSIHIELHVDNSDRGNVSRCDKLFC